MAPVIGYLAGLIAAEGTVAYAVAYVVIEAAFVYAASALITRSTSAKNKVPGQGGSMDVNYYDSEAALRILYGRVRVGGLENIPPLTSGTHGEYLHKDLVFAGHQVDSFGAVQFNTDVIPAHYITTPTGTGSDGAISTGTYAGYATVRLYDGNSSQGGDYILYSQVSSTAFSTDFRGRGIAHAAMTFTYDQSVWKSGVPTVTFELNGKKCYDPRKDSTQSGGSGSHRSYDSTTWEWTANPALCLADYLMANFGGGYAPSEIDWSSVMVAASACDVIVSLPDADFILGGYTFVGSGYSPGSHIVTRTGGGAWDSGLYYTTGYTKGKFSALLYAGGAVAFGLNSTAACPFGGGEGPAMSHGIYWHADTSTVKVVENGTAVLVISHTPIAGVDWATVELVNGYVYYTVNGKLVWVSPAAASSLYGCVAIYSTNGGVVVNQAPRYACNGQLFAATTPDEFVNNVKTLVNAMLGRLVYTNGYWRMYAGGWQTPTFSIAKTDWVSPLSITFDGGIAGRFNRMHCWYIDRQRNWQRVECLPRYNSTYVANDGGKYIDRETDQTLCTDEFEAQRKAEFLLRSSRNQIVVAGKLPLRFQDLSLWDTGTIVFDDLGWISKTFRVVGIDINADGSYDCVFQEEQSTDWTDLAYNEYNAPSKVELPAINQPKPSEPTNLSITQNVNGTLKFVIGKSIIAPLGTRYRVIRSTTSYDASVGTTAYDGESLQVDLTVPNSSHFYYSQAYVNAYVSAYYPNTFGIEAYPGDIMWTTFVSCVGLSTFS